MATAVAALSAVPCMRLGLPPRSQVVAAPPVPHSHRVNATSECSEAWHFLGPLAVTAGCCSLLAQRGRGLAQRQRPRQQRWSAVTATSALPAVLADVPQVQLNDGTCIPQVGYGTYKVGFVPASASSAAAGAEAAAAATQRTARECVREALEVGYRFLDCAQFYGNEAQVGHAIRDSGLPRSALYLESKVWNDKIFEGRAAVRSQFEQTLKDLGTDYLDLYCIHWPVPGKHVDAYLELEDLQKEGKIRSLGVSNYTVEDFKELMSRATVIPVVNQVEINPFLYRKRTISFFQSQGVRMQSYRALRDGKAFDHPKVVALSEKYGRTPAQVLGRWCVQNGFIYIPKSVRRERMLENAAVFDFALEESDMAELDSLTTQEAFSAFRDLYEKCVNRDTPKAGTMEGVKTQITPD